MDAGLVGPSQELENVLVDLSVLTLEVELEHLLAELSVPALVCSSQKLEHLLIG